MRERQHHNGHAQVENNWPRIDHAPGECSHVFDRGEITQQIACCGIDIQKDELNETEKK